MITSAKTRRYLIGAGASGVAALATACASVTPASLRERLAVSIPGASRLSGAAAQQAPVQPALTGPVTYVVLGASDAVGYGVNAPQREGWVPQLASRLPAGSRTVNLGIGGLTLREALQRTLPRAVQAKPDLVTVWLAVNDVLGGVALDQYRADLDTLLGTLRRETTARIAVGNLPDPGQLLGDVQVPAFARRMLLMPWNNAIAAIARQHGAVLVDLQKRWPVAEHPEYIGSDGLHPTAAGYRALADAFHATLKENAIL